VAAGATIIAGKPEQSPSLEHYPTCDRDITATSRELWGDCDGVRIQEHRFGKGRIVCHGNLQSVLSELHVGPDVESSAAEIEWVHRQALGLDIYFLSNQSSSSFSADVSFRVSDRIPELWHADTGTIEDAPVWMQKSNRTSVTIDFDPCGSVFVIFRRRVSDSAAAITKIVPPPQNQHELPLIVSCSGGRYQCWSSVTQDWTFTMSSGRVIRASASNVPEAITIRGPWTVEFLNQTGRSRTEQFEELSSWSQHPDEDVRFFSGTARYSTKFSAPASSLPAGSRFFLELGEIAWMARVRLNGKDLGTMWKPPFRMEITRAMFPGSNELSIDVTNTWKNRLIGDEALPLDERSTWLLFDQAHPAKDGQLDIAGLIGPVQLRIFVPIPLFMAQ
jgi:hypothetical protein